jgi:hypothetical protein
MNSVHIFQPIFIIHFNIILQSTAYVIFPTVHYVPYYLPRRDNPDDKRKSTMKQVV